MKITLQWHSASPSSKATVIATCVVLAFATGYYFYEVSAGLPSPSVTVTTLQPTATVNVGSNFSVTLAVSPREGAASVNNVTIRILTGTSASFPPFLFTAQDQRVCYESAGAKTCNTLVQAGVFFSDYQTFVTYYFTGLTLTIPEGNELRATFFFFTSSSAPIGNQNLTFYVNGNSANLVVTVGKP